MSKYNSLWEYVQSNGNQSFKMTFEEIRDIAGIPIDHSFLKYKKELIDYGYEVGKISMKEQTMCLSIRNCIKRAPKSTVPGQHRFGFEKPHFCSL